MKIAPLSHIKRFHCGYTLITVTTAELGLGYLKLVKFRSLINCLQQSMIDELL